MAAWQYQDLGDGVFRPYLAVWLDPNVRYPAIIDSGADATCIPLPIAQALGVAYDPGVVLQGGGAGGVHNFFKASDDVTLQCAEGAFTIARPSINPQLAFILLGRADFFRIFHCQFDERARIFTLTRFP